MIFPLASKVCAKSDHLKWVEVTDGYCTSRQTIRIQLTECLEKIFIPNVITPNQDRMNDTFFIQGILSGRWQLSIYNRLGTEMYTTIGDNNDWKAQGLSNGVYYYLLREPGSGRSYRGWGQMLR